MGLEKMAKISSCKPYYEYMIPFITAITSHNKYQVRTFIWPSFLYLLHIFLARYSSHDTHYARAYDRAAGWVWGISCHFWLILNT